MPTDCISYQKSGYFTKLINDYLAEKPELKELYNRFPSLSNFKEQIEEKSINFPLLFILQSMKFRKLLEFLPAFMLKEIQTKDQDVKVSLKY